jgi:hypothetical protein
LAEASAAVTGARVAAVTVVAMVEGTGVSIARSPVGAPPRSNLTHVMFRLAVRCPPASAVMSRSPGRASPPGAGRFERST